MATKKKRKKPGAPQAWQPMERSEFHPEYAKRLREAGEDLSKIEVWGNDRYQATARYTPTTDVKTGKPAGDMIWLSIKSNSRRAVRDWRHLQQIKNDIAGPEREAVEIFPAESRLVDTSNEYHLYVLPEGQRVPWGYEKRDVWTPEEIKAFNESERAERGPSSGHARQRAWQSGLTTGRGSDET